MANSREKQILVDGQRNAAVTLTGVLTASDESWVRAIQLSDFVNNDPLQGPLVGLRIDRIDFSVTDPLTALLYWNSNSPQQIAALSQSEELEFDRTAGKKPNRLISGYDGAINLSTVGFVAGNSKGYTIVLSMTKIYTQ